MQFAPIPVETERVATETIGAAIEVHRQLGPGFLEKIYQEALCFELCARGLEFEREKGIVVNYNDHASCHSRSQGHFVLKNDRPPTRLVVEFPRAYAKARIEKNSLLTLVR